MTELGEYSRSRVSRSSGIVVSAVMPSAVAQRSTGALVAQLSDLGEDGQRDLGRGAAAEVEADRRMDRRDASLVHALFAQHVGDQDRLPPAAEQPDVGDARPDGGSDAGGVELVAAGRDD